MIYKNIKQAIFKEKINRFVAKVKIDDVEELVHIKNTGRLTELLVPNAKVILEKSDNTNRKTKYDLVSVYHNGNLVNIDSQILNYVAFDSLNNNLIIDNISNLKREKTYKNSRFDIYFEKNGKKCFMEIKGVNLFKDGFAMFPDAPTSRGSKHINELIDAKNEGYECYILFLIAMEYPKKFTLNKEMDFEFYQNILKAKNSGINILAYNLKILENDIKLNEKIKVIL